MKLNWKKMKGLIPTIVQDEQGKVLMLAYSNKESLNKTLKTEKATYFSRERQKLWKKGETSGNFQYIKKIKTDCDNDALLFIVNQKENACHLNRYSCFKEKKEFNIKELYKIIQSRIKSKNENSYSYKLFRNPKLLRKKILEEARELVSTKNKKQVIWEASDLLYFVTAFLVKRQVRLKQIENKLAERNINKSSSLTKSRREVRK